MLFNAANCIHGWLHAVAKHLSTLQGPLSSPWILLIRVSFMLTTAGHSHYMSYCTPSGLGWLNSFGNVCVWLFFRNLRSVTMQQFLSIMWTSQWTPWMVSREARFEICAVSPYLNNISLLCSLRGLWLPPSVQWHATRLIGYSKLPVGNVPGYTLPSPKWCWERIHTPVTLRGITDDG